MAKVILWESDGKVCVCTPVTTLADAIAKTVPQGVTPLVMEEGDLPDRTYQGAWSIVNRAIVVDDAKKALIDNPVPAVVTSGAFIRAAHELDWLDGIDAAVATIGQQNSLIPLLWARASQFERNHPFIAAVAQAMGKTSGDVDDLFRLAGSYDK